MTLDADLDLLSAHLDGDAAAFAALVARHDDWVYHAARRRLGDDHLADDARQATFLLLARKAETLVRAGVPSVAAWLFHTMHFTCANLRRARTRRIRHEAAAGGQASHRPAAADETRLAMLEGVIADLPPRDREAVVRRFYQRESYARIGAALRISEEAARKRVDRLLARCRVALTLEGIDAEPESLLGEDTAAAHGSGRRRTGWFDSDTTGAAIEQIARETTNMVQQMDAIEFAVMTAEFRVRNVDEHLDFFERLGFRRHWTQDPDADGTTPKASLRGGHARIWLRRATIDAPPASGVTVYVWLDGGEPAVVRHREAAMAQGVAVNQFYYDGTLMNYTVTSPDGYVIGFFSTYRPHAFDPTTDG